MNQGNPEDYAQMIAETIPIDPLNSSIGFIISEFLDLQNNGCDELIASIDSRIETVEPYVE